MRDGWRRDAARGLGAAHKAARALPLAVGVLIALSCAACGPNGSRPATPLFDGATKHAWALDQSARANRVTQLHAFDGLAGPVLRLTAYDDDVAPETPTDNPGAQLVAPNLMARGWCSGRAG